MVEGISQQLQYPANGSIVISMHLTSCKKIREGDFSLICKTRKFIVSEVKTSSQQQLLELILIERPLLG